MLLIVLLSVAVFGATAQSPILIGECYTCILAYNGGICAWQMIQKVWCKS